MEPDLIERLERLLHSFERMQLEDYLSYVSDRRKLFRNNLLIGVARGLGTAVGFALLGALVIVLLQHLMVSNIPIIGEFLAEMVKIVRDRV